MKNAVSILLTLAILAGIFWALTLNRKYKDKIDEVHRLETVVDSVRAIEATPPDTVTIRDTIIQESVKVISKFEPRPDEYNTYNDSIINDSIRVRIEITANQVFDITWNYEPVIIREKETINRPYPVIVDNTISVPANGWYILGGASFAGELIPEIGLYKMRGNSIIGIKALGFGGKIGFGISYGIKL